MPEFIDNENILYAPVRSTPSSRRSSRLAGDPRSARRKDNDKDKDSPLEITAVSVATPAGHHVRVEWALRFLARCLVEEELATSSIEPRRTAA